MKLTETEGFVHLDEVALEYRLVPARDPALPVLIFLHEGLGCVDLWRDFPDRVAEATGCAALIYSRQGYGASSPVQVPRPLTYMHREARQVLPRLLDQLGFAKVILVGHSDGASIALIHAGSVRDDRVAGVIAVAPHVFNEEICVASIRQAAEAYRTTDLRAKLERLHGDNVDGAFWGWNRAWLDPDFWYWNIEEFLPGIAVPLMVIQGADDEYGSAAQWEAIKSKSGSGADVVVLANCRHSPHRDQRDATLAAMTRFIGQTASLPFQHPDSEPFS